MREYEEDTISTKKIVFGVVFVIILLITALVADNLVETVEQGSYQIKQAAVTGEMSAKMTPGMWMQMFGDMTNWPVSETFYFTKDSEGGDRTDQSIEVRYVDGSICNVCGTLRVVLPTTENGVIALSVKHGYRTYADLEQKLILPTVRNALRLTANLMTAQESYAEKRSDFIVFAWDQIQNGLYETVEEKREILDLVSGKKVAKVFKVIKKDKDGNCLYRKNPMAGLDISLVNFEVKQFNYAPKVKEQIATQQEAYMAVATARANAQKADQEAKEQAALGKKAVVQAKYKEEEEKIKAVVKANKDKETAEIKAQQKLEVAKLAKLTAEQTKQEQILLGEGEASRKKAVLLADGALNQKLETFEKVQDAWAKAFSQRQVPTLVMGGSGKGTDKGTTDFAQMMQLMVANQMGLDLSIPLGRTAKK